MSSGGVFRVAGRWLRGNLHTHTTETDGDRPVADALALYRAKGYDFVAISDHRKTTDTACFSDESFLTIPAIELDCQDPERGVGYHVVGLGVTPFAQDEALRKGPGQQLVDAVIAAGGIALLAHPYWLGLDFSDVIAVRGAFALEVYNATCARHGKERGEVHWDGLLERGERIFGVATDDTHKYDMEAAEAWVMVRAEELTAPAVLAALQEGQFYASRGPAIVDMGIDGGNAWVHCSPVKEVRFIGARGSGRTVRAPEGETLVSARSRLPRSPYLRVECIDSRGRAAWSPPVTINSR